MTDEQLADDSEPLGLLAHDGAEPLPIVRSLEYTFTFPPQQHAFDEGDDGFDPQDGGTSWTVCAVDNAAGTIRLRRGRTLAERPLPGSLLPPGPFGTKTQQAGDGRYPHLEQALRRELPLGGGRLQCATIDEQRVLLDRLENSYLVVQGRPVLAKPTAAHV